MKKKIILIIIAIILLSITKVNAETFKEGSYLTGEYISKKHNNKTYYLTVQYIKDSSGNIIYCLEPYAEFNNTTNYQESTSYSKLTKTKLRKIELLAYYGYGYTGRKESKWYAITQYLIWTTIDSDKNIYFTDKLNGNKISKYQEEIKEILKDIENHEEKPNIQDTYTVNYNDSLEITNLNTNYDIVSSIYTYSQDKNYLFQNITEDSTISYQKKSNKYQNSVTIYTSSNSQDLIKPGNVENTIYNIDIKVQKGDISLDIQDDNSIYTIESDFSNTCYALYNSQNEEIDRVCTGTNSMQYTTETLPYGTYTIKQLSNGIGYLKDSKEYQITIDETEEHPKVTLYNLLLRNTLNLNKYLCQEEDCKKEPDAEFSIYDSQDNLVTTLKTDNNGTSSYTLGYGTYKVVQISGKENYTLNDPFTFKVQNEEDDLTYNLNDYLIKEVEEVEKVEKVEETPPATGISFTYLISNLATVIKKLISCILFIITL